MNHSFSRKSSQSPCWALVPLLWPSEFPMQTSTSESLLNYRFTYLSVSSTRFISDLKTGSGCFISPSPACTKCLATGDARNSVAGWMKSPWSSSTALLLSKARAEPSSSCYGIHGYAMSPYESQLSLTYREVWIILYLQGGNFHCEKGKVTKS